MDPILIPQDAEYDLAELEARLYSQIHHSTELWDEPVDQNSLKNRLLQLTSRPYSLTNFSSNSNRYWVPDYSPRFSSAPTNEITNKSDGLQNNSVGMVDNVPNKSMVPAINDVISICDDVQNLPTAPQINPISKKAARKLNKNKQIFYDDYGKKISKKKRQRHRRKMRLAGLDPDLDVYLSIERPTKIFGKYNLCSNSKISSEKICDKDKVIVVPSDSESDSIIEVPLPPPTIYTIHSSDEEVIEFDKQSDKDIHNIDLNKEVSEERNINTEPEIPEIIEANCLIEILDAEKIAEPIENTKNKEAIASSLEIEKERSDLLCTPDSSANDFIEQDIRNMNRIKFFNFNWHGDDLVIPEKEAHKTGTTAADVYETESSCSEAGPRNMPIFNVVDFENPVKEIFCEPTLTKFSNFITPLRNKSPKLNAEFTTPTFSPISTKAIRVNESANADTRENLSCSSDGFNSDSAIIQTNKKKSKKKKKQKKKNDNQESDNNEQEGREKKSKKKSKSDTESRAIVNEKKGKRKSASKSDSESNNTSTRRKKLKYQNESDVIEKLNNKKVKKNYEGDKIKEVPKQKKLKIQNHPDLCNETSENIINEQRTPKEKKAKKISESDKTIEGLKQKKSKLQVQSNTIEMLGNEITETSINEQRIPMEEEVEGLKEKTSKDIIEKLDNVVLKTLINEQCTIKEKGKKNLEGDKMGGSSREKTLKLQDKSDTIEELFIDSETKETSLYEKKKVKNNSESERNASDEERSGKNKKSKKTASEEHLQENNERPVSPTQQKNISIEVACSPKPAPQKEETELISNSNTSTPSAVPELKDGSNQVRRPEPSTSTKSKKEDGTNNAQIFESPSGKTVLPVKDPVVEYYKDTYFADDHLFVTEINKNPQFSFMKSYDKISQKNTKELLCIPSTSKEPANSDMSIICCDSSDSDDVAIIENIMPTVQKTVSTDIILNVRQLEVTPVESSVQSFSFVSNFNKMAKKKTFSDFFTYDMNKFYNEPWEDELADLKEMQASMTADASKWKVINEDINPRRRGPMCTKCRERGHIRMYCRKPRGPRKCVLCGTIGHDELRCPDSFCTSCRAQTRFPTTQCNQCHLFRQMRCSTCYFFGHHPRDCPDLWRRYHLTTTESSQLTVPEMLLKPIAHRWCSNCAQRGHLEDQCTRLRMSNYSINPQVVNYIPVYNTNSPVIPPEPNIPMLADLRVTLSDLRNYKNDVISNNSQKYIAIIRRLQRMCGKDDEYRIQRLNYLMTVANNNQFDKRNINELYQIRSKLFNPRKSK